MDFLHVKLFNTAAQDQATEKNNTKQNGVCVCLDANCWAVIWNGNVPPNAMKLMHVIAG